MAVKESLIPYIYLLLELSHISMAAVSIAFEHLAARQILWSPKWGISILWHLAMALVPI